MSSQGDDTVRPVWTGWTDALIVCRKCARKHAEFGADGKTSIRKALRMALRAAGLRGRVGIIQAGCFGVCPKRGVTVMQASRPGELAVVRSTDIDGGQPAGPVLFRRTRRRSIALRSSTLRGLLGG